MIKANLLKHYKSVSIDEITLIRYTLYQYDKHKMYILIKMYFIPELFIFKQFHSTTF